MRRHGKLHHCRLLRMGRWRQVDLVNSLIIALGFFLMSLDPFIDAKQFSISLYVAPIVVVAGFIEIIYAIMYKPAAPTVVQNEEI